jgi:hypothetical protein
VGVDFTNFDIEKFLLNTQPSIVKPQWLSFPFDSDFVKKITGTYSRVKTTKKKGGMATTALVMEEVNVTDKI